MTEKDFKFIDDTWESLKVFCERKASRIFPKKEIIKFLHEKEAQKILAVTFKHEKPEYCGDYYHVYIFWHDKHISHYLTTAESIEFDDEDLFTEMASFRDEKEFETARCYDSKGILPTYPKYEE